MRLLRVSVVVVAPAMAVPFLRHCWLTAPVAVTVKLTLVPGAAMRLTGCAVMTGTEPTTTGLTVSRAVLLVAVPAELVARQV